MKKFLQKLAGYSPEVVSLVSSDLQRLITLLGLSIFLPCLLALIGGFDIALQYELPIPLCIFFGFLTSFIYFLIDMFFVGLSSIGGKTIMYFRFFISFSFSCIVSFPIPIMFQNNKIENYLKEQIENKKLVLDSIYKQDTNKNFEILLKKEKVRNDGLEAYSNEGLTGKGENYVIKREKYMKDSLDWYNEKLKVDSLQGVINAKYEERLNYIKNIKSADYFTKLEAMFAMAFGGNILMIFMIIITFVPLVLIDLIPIVFKLGLKKLLLNTIIIEI
ncbi:MAG: hypothetical protein IPQ19_14245 [Bacteroidetes bacterium]|nr:hypothetical protein [Bacteroidota bacterium]